MARELTRDERIEARHWLQQLSEQARAVRNAVDVNGRLSITDESWLAQWLALRKHLDDFTDGVMAGREPVGRYGVDRNE